MSSMFFHHTKHWLKSSDSAVAKNLFRFLKALRLCQLPKVPLLFSVLYRLHTSLSNALSSVLRILWWTPLFRSKTSGPSQALYLYGGMPLISEGLNIELGNRCRVSGATTFSGRSSAEPALLKIGDNVDVGWQTTIAVGKQVILGNNVRLAGRCFIAGYPGHPLNAEQRAAGLPELDEQVGDVILEDDVWLATGVSVMAGVTIGKGTVVAAGSIVTKSLPAGVLAAGVPAKVIKSIEEK
ncbi:acyltransferase [Agarivorans sp. B2Z047]|uniref:acyltransferase n=1 Tax=Agarivorans sp. B2Z047 TaxID=2652721 RepID=UPI00128E90D5|nr:acyltransferase [Agarivorans sp. B2Z047]MPW29384.1 acyltransferase [Agarivorans sp. B2Z047]UQN44974.1 acyltransferase [Agarivorans sp. B2Z047]